ncbi:MAG: pyruvate-formate lyase-activating enzyme [Myxococcota bacterium]|jgi:pyruvate-formate lyase-activating enzyme
MTALLTPYVPTLFAALEDVIRESLGLKEGVIVRFHNRERKPIRRVRFEVILPNAVTLEMSLEDVTLGGGSWRRAGRLGLSHRPRDGVDPMEDAATRPSLEAVGALFEARQRRDGARLSAALWTEHTRLRAYLGLDDDYYRRIFFGVIGGSANLRLGFRCNQDCGFCWQSRKWPEPPAELYRTWLDEIAAAGIRQLTFTGGEPTLHRALPGLLQRAREHGMRTMVQTNAIQLSRPAVLDRLKAAGIDRLFISFHAADAETSDKMTRAPNTHKRTVAGIEAALAAGLAVSLNCVVEAANHDRLAEHAALIVDRFVRPFPDNPITSVNYSRPQTYFDQELWLESLVRMDVLEPQLLQAVRTLRAEGVVLDVTAGSCGLPACLLRELPELIYLPEPDEVGMADPSFSRHAPDTACGRCALRHRCQGPGQGYLKVFGDQGLVPFDTMPELPEGFPLSL